MSTYYLSHEWFRIQRQVIARDRRRCQYCGKRGSRVDHVMPRSRGGSDHPDNLVCACVACDTAAGDKPFRDVASKRAWIRHKRGLEAAA